MKIDKNTQNTLLLVGGGIAIYFILLKPILEKLGLKKTAEQIDQENKQKKSLEDYINQSKQNQKQTKSNGEWLLIADQIYENLRYSSISDDKEAAGANLSRPKNDADVATLIQQFGKRQEYYFGIPTGGLKNLPEFVISNLDRTKIEAINNNYVRKNIRFRW
jgi:biopolymer transport protein ExbB/TolQ